MTNLISMKIFLFVLTFIRPGALQSNTTNPNDQRSIETTTLSSKLSLSDTTSTVFSKEEINIINTTATTIELSTTGSETVEIIQNTTASTLSPGRLNDTNSLIGKNGKLDGENISLSSTTLYPLTSTAKVAHSPYGVPNNCSAYKQFAAQPQYNPFAKILKCCPDGQNFHYENGTKYCAPETIPFNVNVISARFYLGCIEDEERVIKLDTAHMITCSSGLVYNQNYKDKLYILQNGSLLRVDENFNSYDIFNNYCLDMDTEENLLTAIVCMNNDGLMIVTYAQVWIYIICMITSVPCLIVTAILYTIVTDLRDIHGKSLVYHSLCLAGGLLLLSITQFRTTIDPVMGYFIQYFLLASFFWLFLMCVDITVHTWFYLPKGLDVREKRERLHITIYVIIAMGIPVLLVGATYLGQLGQDTVYHFKAENVSQRYFLPPIALLLILSLLLLFATLYGFYKLNALNANMFIQMMKLQHKDNERNKPKLNTRLIAKVERMAKKTLILYSIMTVIWAMEMLTYYTSGKFDPIMFDLFNALQGIFIFIIYVCLPVPWRTIKRWYRDRGSLNLPITELQELNPNRNNINNISSTTNNNNINNRT